MDDNFQIQEWVVSPKLNSLRRNGKMVHLEPKVMQVLVCLAKSPGVVSKEKLMQTVWTDTFVTDDVLTRFPKADIGCLLRSNKFRVWN